MDIEFDPKKDTSNLVKHGIRLARASEFSPSQSWRTRARTTARRDIVLSASSAPKLMHSLSPSPKTENPAASEFAPSASDLPRNRRSGTMTSRKKPDADNPEWTRGDFAKAKAPRDVLPADVLSKFGKHRGPQKAPRKVPVSIRLSPIVVSHFRQQGPGWQARIDAVLTKIVKKETRPAPTRIRKAG